MKRENIEKKLIELEELTSKENFWKNQNLVKKTLKQKKFFEDLLNSYQKLSKVYIISKIYLILPYKKKTKKQLKTV